ncbi:MAG: DNA recombination protein RmuC [Clostridia bacterium]|nr:DNA recombination protein RmuC [Clostridia bacterium]
MSIALCVISIILLIILILKMPKNDSSIRQELITQRKENAEQSLKNRQELSESISRLNMSMENRFEIQNRKIEYKLSQIEEKNEKSIENIRKTVDENLHETLNKSIGESFKTVNEQLEQVYKGLGEMQTLAAGVGDLKKIFSNVKNRGVWGELQLERLLCQMLSSEQYIKNAVIKQGSGQQVEFAVKLPSNDQTVLLPVDSKFPIESYTRLLEAYDNNPEGIQACAKELENAVKKSAMDISEKYINPPYTTDYAIMFLPIEGLYCEVARRDGLLELLQQKYNIIISGPTTFTALLTSLQLGFKTVSIEKRTAKVWQTLSKVKKEFENFSGVLTKAQTHISQASDDLDKLVGVRSRAILNKLNGLEMADSLEETEKEETFLI